MNGEEPMTFLMLPNDLVLNCLARVSRLYYPTLSLVSKRFHSMLASRELYQTRTLLSRTDSCLYVCLKHPGYKIPQHWYILYPRPGSPKKVLVPITSPSKYQPGCVSVGSNIYVIGGTYDDNPSSSVMVMDCRSHTWHEAPSMKLARRAPCVCVLDEKIYVTGGCRNPDPTSWMEVFDTKTQTWEFESSGPHENLCSGFRYQSVGYDGAVYVKCSEEHKAYKLNKGRWRKADLGLNRNWFYSLPYCVIDNVLYTSSSRMINWYDSEQRCWHALKGLETFFSALPPHVNAYNVADYGGKLAVFWEENMCDDFVHPENIIWCAEITLEKRKDGKIWGKLEWSSVVSTTNEPSYVVDQVLVTTF